jgi:hypothetical protein
MIKEACSISSLGSEQGVHDADGGTGGHEPGGVGSLAEADGEGCECERGGEDVGDSLPPEVDGDPGDQPEGGHGDPVGHSYGLREVLVRRLKASR